MILNNFTWNGKKAHKIFNRTQYIYSFIWKNGFNDTWGKKLFLVQDFLCSTYAVNYYLFSFNIFLLIATYWSYFLARFSIYFSNFGNICWMIMSRVMLVNQTWYLDSTKLISIFFCLNVGSKCPRFQNDTVDVVFVLIMCSLLVHYFPNLQQRH